MKLLSDFACCVHPQPSLYYAKVEHREHWKRVADHLTAMTSEQPDKKSHAQQDLIDHLLRSWPLNPKSLTVRLVYASQQRRVIQMRIEMGLLQLETEGRPDGTRPFGSRTVLDYLDGKVLHDPDGFILNDDECFECDREFIQFYHRRVCWLTLREYDAAQRDARHTLRLMDLCRDHSPSDAWTASHEQYRPFVVYHRAQAEAMSLLAREEPADAIHAINRAIPEVEEAFLATGDDDMEKVHVVARLVELRETLRERFDVGRTLQEQLADAIESEQYELAARLRDTLGRQRRNRHES